MGTEDQTLKLFPPVPNRLVGLWVQANPVMTRVSGHCSRVPTVPTVFKNIYSKQPTSTKREASLASPVLIGCRAVNAPKGKSDHSPKSARSTKSDRFLERVRQIANIQLKTIANNADIIRKKTTIKSMNCINRKPLS